MYSAHGDGQLMGNGQENAGVTTQTPGNFVFWGLGKISFNLAIS